MIALLGSVLGVKSAVWEARVKQARRRESGIVLDKFRAI